MARVSRAFPHARRLETLRSLCGRQTGRKSPRKGPSSTPKRKQGLFSFLFSPPRRANLGLCFFSCVFWPRVIFSPRRAQQKKKLRARKQKKKTGAPLFLSLVSSVLFALRLFRAPPRAVCALRCCLPSEKERKRKEQAKERARKRERERAIEQRTNAAATAALFSLSLFLSAFFSRALSLPARGLERASLLSVPRGIGRSRAINWKKKKERKKGNRRSIASTFSLFDLFSSPSLPETHPGSLSRLPLASKHNQPIWNQKTDSSNRSKSEDRK